MQAYRIDRFGSVDGIVLRSSEDPRLGLKQLLMRVRASSLNYRDLMVLKTGGRGPTKIGVVPLSDGAGEVAAIGEGVTRVKIGDRIAGCFHPRWFGGPIKPDYLTDRLGANLDGMLAEYAAFNEEAVVPLPSHLSFEEAATLPCAAVTAWVARWMPKSVPAWILRSIDRHTSAFIARVAPALGRSFALMGGYIDQLAEARIIVLDVADARAHRPADHVLGRALVQMARSDRLGCHAELAEVGNGQADERRGAVRGSSLRPRNHHSVRALVSSIQAQSARPGGDDGRARPVDGAHDHHALGAALRTRVRETLATALLRHRQTAVKPSRHSNDQE
jgi:hypothetical protein